MKRLPLGPLMVDIAGTTLTPLERERLCHPLVGGLILFARNYQDRDQLQALCTAIHALREPALPIAIDHEGGRVQRCREEFTRLPAMRHLGTVWDRDPDQALETSQAVGYVLAAELRVCGVDFSFTPVLDLDWGRSSVIGDRAFHRTPAAVTALAGAFCAGLRQAGMIACGKHFPGHGWTEADSHVAIPVDERTWEELQADLEPYRRLKLDAVMPAHVIYPRIDPHPAGFSKFWIGFLRDRLRFDGVVFSDDLSMQGASVVGGLIERAEAAYTAGCDMLLVCNAPESVDELLANWRASIDPQRTFRISRLLAQFPPLDWKYLSQTPLYRTGVRICEEWLA